MSHVRILAAFSPSPGETQIHYCVGGIRWWAVLVDSRPPHIVREGAA